MKISGRLLGNIIATIISVQPPTNASASQGPPPAAAAASWLSSRAYGELPHTHNVSHARATSPTMTTANGLRASTLTRTPHLADEQRLPRPLSCWRHYGRHKPRACSSAGYGHWSRDDPFSRRDIRRLRERSEERRVGK